MLRYAALKAIIHPSKCCLHSVEHRALYLYVLRFEKMNGTDMHILALKKDDVLSVSYAIRRGYADISIGIRGEKPVYTGNDIDNGIFRVIAPKDGEYVISVKAKKAEGIVCVYAESASEK